MKDLSTILAEVKERADKAKKAGCLPADNCVWALPDPMCIFCGRESGSPMNMYREEWGELDTLRSKDIPRLILIIEKLMEQRDTASRCCYHEGAHATKLNTYNAELEKIWEKQE